MEGKCTLLKSLFFISFLESGFRRVLYLLKKKGKKTCVDRKFHQPISASGSIIFNQMGRPAAFVQLTRSGSLFLFFLFFSTFFSLMDYIIGKFSLVFQIAPFMNEHEQNVGQMAIGFEAENRVSTGLQL